MHTIRLRVAWKLQSHQFLHRQRYGLQLPRLHLFRHLRRLRLQRQPRRLAVVALHRQRFHRLVGVTVGAAVRLRAVVRGQATSDQRRGPVRNGLAATVLPINGDAEFVSISRLALSCIPPLLAHPMIQSRPRVRLLLRVPEARLPSSSLHRPVRSPQNRMSHLPRNPIRRK